MSDSITSIDINYSNNGGAHTASIVVAKDVQSSTSRVSVGKINGALGAKSTFTQAEINNILKNFVLTEEQTNKTPTGTTVTKTYTDKTSLVLNSNVLLVRGISAPPEVGSLSFEGNVSPYGFEFPTLTSSLSTFKKIEKFGGVVVIGDTYYVGNIRSGGVKETLVYDKQGVLDKAKTTLTVKEAKAIGIDAEKLQYQQASDGSYVSFLGLKNSLQAVEKIGGISRNQRMVVRFENVSEFLNQETDNFNSAPSAPEIKYGYTIDELKKALDLIKVKYSGLPSNKTLGEVLFDTGGTFSAVLSAIAGTLGYYWYVDPDSGEIIFISSSEAALIKIKNPLIPSSLDNITLSASYGKSALNPKVVHTIIGSADNSNSNAASGGSGSTAPSTVGNTAELAPEPEPNPPPEAPIREPINATYDNIYKMNFSMIPFSLGNNDSVNKIGGLYTFMRSKQASSTNFEKFCLLGGIADNSTKPEAFKSIVKTPSLQKALSISPKIGSRYSAIYAKEDRHLIDLTAFNKAQALFTRGYLFISKGMSGKSIDRVTFSGGPLNIHGPFPVGTKISNIEELSDVHDLYGDERLTPKGGSGDFCFVGYLPNSIKKTTVTDYLYQYLEDKVEYWTRFGINRIGGTENPFKKTRDLAIKSLNQFKSDYKVVRRSVRMPYKIAGTVKDEPSNTGGPSGDIVQPEPEPKPPSSNQSEKDQYIGDKAANNYDTRKFEVILNGANGNLLNPLSLNSFSGTLVDASLMKDYLSRLNKFNSIVSPNLETSSRTIYGLYVPIPYEPTISSLSISVGSDGIQTTISESTVKLIPKETSIITSNASIARNIQQYSPIHSLTARGKNFMGL